MAKREVVLSSHGQTTTQHHSRTVITLFTNAEVACHHGDVLM